jgi:hypothetical protein
MQVRISSTTSYDVATFGHYAGATESNYSKLLQIGRVVSLINDGAFDEQFCVAQYSSALYSNKYGLPSDQRSLVILASKGHSADEFWDVVRRIRRPTVFYKRRPASDWSVDTARPLYSPTDDDVLKVVSASVESPIHISFEGVAQIIRQLFHGHDDERRAQERHELEMEAIRVENVAGKARAARALLTVAEEVKASTISPQYKRKILSLVNGVTDRQQQLTERLGADVELPATPARRRLRSPE